MALSLLVPCSRYARLALLSMKRTSYALLRPLLALSLALLLPRFLALLSSLAPLVSFLLHPASVFVFANLLILAIFLSSQSPPSHSRSPCTSFAALFPPPAAFSPHDLRHHAQQQLMRQRPRRAPEPASSDFSKCLVPVSLEFDEHYHVACASSRRAISNSTAQLSRQFCATPYADAEMKQLIILERSSEDLRLTKRRSLKEPVQRVAVNAGMVRRNPDSRIGSVTYTTVSEKVVRQNVNADNASAVVRAVCGDKSSSMIIMDVAPIENLIDEDLNRRCTEFIASNYQNWKKESMCYRT